MSEAVTRPGTTPLARPGLLDSLEPLLHAWLPRQRWFAGKGRPVTGFQLVSATELLPLPAPGDWTGTPGAQPGLLHLLIQAEQPGTRGGGRAGPADCYQLLLGVHGALPPRLAPALIGHVTRGPLAGLTVYEALHDPRLAEVLLEALRMRARVGELRFERDTVHEIGPGLAPRLLGTEQSNSSLVYGDTFILKLFRRIVPGINPDLELPQALARAGCPRVPAPAAWFEADAGGTHTGAPRPRTGGAPPAAGTAKGMTADLTAGTAEGTASPDEVLVLGVLQPFLRDAADGWELALAELAAGRDFRPQARALGAATAEVHRALARALPTLTMGRPQVERLAAGMRSRLDAAAQAVAALRPYVPGLRSAFDALASLGADGSTWNAQRVHGDLHLGQCLRSPGGEWSLIDFEGEPVRPLAERRMPQPPVRDVAGMLRSFDYAARQHRPWSPDWADGCRGAYCTGYAEVSGTDPREDTVLLRAYETDKAVYEVMYEARHRPDWLSVPLSAIDRLAAGHPA